MRYAYADPPYPGCAHLYPENTEVDHVALVARLVGEYPDGWALSTSSVALRSVIALCPEDVRVAAWVKPFAVFRPNVNPAYAWEPILWRGGRTRRGRKEATVVDWVAASITLRRGVVGAKPDPFWRWLLDLLGWQAGDEIHDLYPGTGRLAAILAAANKQTQIGAVSVGEATPE